MDTQADTIKDIRKKVEKLLKQFDALQKENDLSKKKLTAFETKTAELQAALQKSQQQNLLYKASLQQLDGADKKKMDFTISAYINQLDKAIALLSE